MGNYVVVIGLIETKTAKFITAYAADTPASLEKIKKGPRWA
jgi:hypothetical protein